MILVLARPDDWGPSGLPFLRLVSEVFSAVKISFSYSLFNLFFFLLLSYEDPHPVAM